MVYFMNFNLIDCDFEDKSFFVNTVFFARFCIILIRMGI